MAGGFAVVIVRLCHGLRAEGLGAGTGFVGRDGIITNGETTIKLRRSVGLTDDFTEDEFVNNAKVVVEREDGAVFTCANSSGKGEYKVDMGELDPGSRYRLHISLDGLEYESDYLGPEITPPIDSLLAEEGAGRGGPSLCVYA